MKNRLIPTETIEQLAAAIGDHIRNCDHDHSGTFKQLALIDYDPALSTLSCRSCGDRQPLTCPPADGDTLENYICNLLQQQQKYFDRHFASCILTKVVA